MQQFSNSCQAKLLLWGLRVTIAYSIVASIQVLKGVRCRRENEISVKELGIVVFHHKDTNLSVVVKTTCFYHSDIEGDS